MEKKKKFLIFGVMFLCTLMITGVSFALWQITLQQTEKNILTTGCFQIEFSDKNSIHLEKAYPISNAEGKSLIPYEFTITNTCNSFASYQINLEILNTTTLENLDYLKVMLDDKANILTENEVVMKTLENVKTSYKLKTGYLRENGSKTFSLRLWMDEDTPTREEFMNKMFESKVTIIATYKENLDNNIETIAVSQNESFSGSETFQIHATSENYDLVAISDDLETWEELEIKGKDITVEKTVTANGTYMYYFQDEAENVQEVTVIATKIDDKKPIANMTITKENNKIKIDASNSLDNETSIAKYYYSKDGTNYVESTNSIYEFPIFDYGLATTMLENYKNQKVYVKVEDEYQNVSDIKEYSLGVNELLYDETVDNNLRYVGTSPNNYVTFNDELWRVIGVMNNIDDGTGKKESRIKLIRNESIGNYSWDTSNTNINNGGGINEWSEADINILLNDYYYNSKSNQTCYTGQYNTSVSCSFNGYGLSFDSKKFINDAIWNLGCHENEEELNTAASANTYNWERSNNTGKICNGEYGCNDTVIRTTKWKGKIGLMYPSDYVYAFGGQKSDRDQCLSSKFFELQNLDICRNNNWLYKSDGHQWTISPSAIPEWATCAYFVTAEGFSINGVSVSNAFSIKPVVHLNSNVKIISGNGSKEVPFELSAQ